MYLKSIEVQGFKSFANKLVFEFHKGITGIVGPNGSGKSNVSDAVRWVLGEQSAKQLRSGNMQDVIFAGTEARKPQSFAYVAITFDNSDHHLAVDYSEVTVSRRLYRSGESEYLLNHVPVRLKDIHDIFYDTGIGKEGYSIIGQGQVEKILNGKPEERRELFDEAAGIVKFKKRKAAALKKLQDEQQNLVRVSDILKELTGRLEPMKKQSAEARIYLDQKQNLKQFDINLFLLDDERATRQLGEISERSRIADEDTRQTRQQFDETKLQYEKIEQEISSADEELSSLTEESGRNRVVLQQLSGQIDLLNEQIRAASQSGEQFRQRTEQIERDILSRREEAKKRQEEAEEAGEAAREVKEKEKATLDAIRETDEEIASLQQKVNDAKSEVIGVLNSRAQVKGQIQRYDTMLEQMGIRQSEISSRLLRLQEEENRARKESEQFTGEAERQEQERAGSEQKLSEVRDQERALSHEIEAETARHDQLQSEYHRHASRLQSLKAMAERYEGYGVGIRKIMEQKDRNPGIRGVVADLLDVPEEYEQAIETALGGSMRNIVTDNEATAKYLIEYLKSNRYGRVTFLPLTSLKERTFTNQEAAREIGVIGLASDLVRTDPAYEKLKSFLLGRILVIDSIDHAIRIGRKYHHSIYMVTVAGESFAPGGSITGGSFRNTENLLGRKREIDELEERVKTLTKEQAALQKGLSEKRDKRTALRNKALSLNEEMQKLRLAVNTSQLRLKQADEQLRISKINRASLEKENQEIASQINEVRAKSGDISLTLHDSVSSEEELNREADSLTKEIALCSERKAGQSASLTEIRARLAALSEKSAYFRETLSRLGREEGELRAEQERIGQEITNSGAEQEKKAEEIREIRATIRSGEEKEAENAKRIEELHRKKKDLTSQNKAFFEKRDELTDRLARLDKESYRLNSQKERLEETRETNTSYMWEEYELTPSKIREYKLPEFEQDRQVVKKEILKIRDQLKKLGSVNVHAIEEYRELTERHTFLDAQYKDLVESEKTLIGIIDELDQGMRTQFNEKFAEIRREFDLAFRDLFGGGHGDVEIDPDTDVLEADIRIIAHPPGKKLQNMMQMSGGEKSLTAIALLFAIQNLKPSPFCLLDEIEAALDDSNVSRFAEYLHKLTKNTQFIIITHRRGTMTAADRLYGITMQEKGVSTLVSVSLIEDDLSS